MASACTSPRTGRGGGPSRRWAASWCSPRRATLEAALTGLAGKPGESPVAEDLRGTVKDPVLGVVDLRKLSDAVRNLPRGLGRGRLRHPRHRAPVAGGHG